MNRIMPAKSTKQEPPHELTCSEDSQIGFNKTQQLTVPIQVIKKKSLNKIPSTNQGSECRICLQTEAQSSEYMIQPCQCTGSVQSVHQSCFTEWVSRSLASKSNRQLGRIAKEGIQCDLCKMKFEIKFNFEKTCTNMDKFKEKVKYRQCEFFTLCFMLITTLVLMVATIALMPHDPLHIDLDSSPGPGNPAKYDGKQDWLKVVLLASLGVLVLILVFILYLIINEYGFTYRTEFGYKGKNQVKTARGIVLE